MKNEEMQNFVNNIQEKLGKENASVIMDDLGILLTDNSSMNKTLDEKQAEIQKQKSLNDKLIATNSSLLQQVGVNKNGSQDFNSNFKNETTPTQENKNQSISIYDCFDEKGNFKK